ncbi:coiled-coil domain-containing protein 77 [Oncorhynchus mykiss]|uniref:coiled-coil domain-containing protein 77 n=1 Tax=Oncorhynchus mykiss TaxID=8022 RepID=UPI001877EBA3|nr:coiled-coil domain-containing protein 77 [Oncorhynchus mykiss]
MFQTVFPSRPTGRTPGVEDSPLPPITERLAHLCASRELLEFYRGKVVQFDGEHEDLLEKYRCTTEDQKLQWEVGVSELQKALREREHCACTRRTTYSRSEGNHKSRSEEVVNGGSSEQYRGANQTLVLQVLPAQMEEQTGLSKKKVESLLEDRRIHVEEGQVQHQRDQDPITDKYDRSDKMAKRLQMMTQRYEALKKRAAMEVEGFKSDIKHLQQKLKDVEKQLFKVTLNVGPDHPTRGASDQRSDQEGPG